MYFKCALSSQGEVHTHVLFRSSLSFWAARRGPIQNPLESSSREQASHTNLQSYPKWYLCRERSAGKGHASRGGDAERTLRWKLPEIVHSCPQQFGGKEGGRLRDGVSEVETQA